MLFPTNPLGALPIGDICQNGIGPPEVDSLVMIRSFPFPTTGEKKDENRKKTGILRWIGVHRGTTAVVVNLSIQVDFLMPRWEPDAWKQRMMLVH